jgi:hypothetical protein
MVDTFHEIVDPADPLFDSFWLPLYRSAFPDDERVPEDEHVAALAAQDEHVVVGMDGDQPVSMARFDVIAESSAGPYGYLMYMAVADAAISRGHGQQMFGEILRRLAGSAHAPRLLIFEVQRPELDQSIEPHQSADRRIDFYRRLGAHVLKGVDYVQHVPGQPGVPMLIMARPLTDDVTATEALGVAQHLFESDLSVTGAASFA